MPVIVQPVRTTVNQATQFRQRGYNISEWMSDRYKPPLASETPNGTLGDFFSIVPPPYPRNFINITEYDLTNFTFVTSSSSNHFNESLDMVAGVQHHFPDKKLIYYDLGLTSNQRKQVCTIIFFEWGMTQRCLTPIYIDPQIQFPNNQIACIPVAQNTPN